MTQQALRRVFLLGFLALCLLLAYLLKASYDTTLSQARDDAGNLVEILEGRLEATLRRVDASLHALAETLPPQALELRHEERYRGQVTAMLRRYREQFPELGNFFVWDAEGQSLYAPRAGGAAAQRHSIAQREGFRLLRSDPQARIAYSDSIRGVISGQLTVVVYVPVRDPAGRLLGVLTGTLDLEYFDRMFSALQLRAGSVVFVRRADNHKLVLRYPMLAGEINKPVRNRLQQRIDAGETAGHDRFRAATDGQNRIYGFRKLGVYPYYVVVGLSEPGAFADWHRQVGVVIISVVLMALLLVLVLQRMRRIEQEREAARQEAEQALALLREAINSLSSGIIIFDRQDRVVMCNEAIRPLFPGLEDQLLVGRPFEEIIRIGAERGLFHGVAGDLEAWVAKRVRQHRLADGRAYEIELAQGRWMQFSEHSTPNGHIVGSCIDITERKQLEAGLREQATTDALTGLPNRRQFLGRLEEELERVRRRATREACVLMLDLDHFKRINDQYGHGAGDSLLRHFAQLLRQELRLTDSSGRMGGEEFAVILPGTGLETAEGFAQRLCDRLASRPLNVGAQQIRVTVSVGISAIDPDDLTSDAVLSRADAALYRAKKGGRNRVESGV